MRLDRITGTIIVLAIPCSVSQTAQASNPIPVAIVGCIKEGKFYSHDTVGPALRSAEFSALEGKTVRIEGYLTRHDQFRYARALFVIDEKCDENLHKYYVLCSPCATLPGLPHKSLPARESGTAVEISNEALKEFDGWPKSCGDTACPP